MTGAFRINVEVTGTFQSASAIDIVADAVGRQFVAALKAAGQTVNKAVLETVVEVDLSQPPAPPKP